MAACCSDAEQNYIGRTPVLGSELESAEIGGRIGVKTVACTSSPKLGANGLRHLGWALEGQDVDLVVAPGLVDVAGPRVLGRAVLHASGAY